MSENLDLVRSIYADWERGDYRFTEWAHPEIEFEVAGGPAPGSWTGVEAMETAWFDFLSAWDEFGHEVDEYRKLDGERVLLLVRLSGSGQASGLQLVDAGDGSEPHPRSWWQGDEARHLPRPQPCLRRPRPLGVDGVAREVMTTYPPSPTTDENAQFASR